jgi:hypothetical protein
MDLHVDRASVLPGAFQRRPKSVWMFVKLESVKLRIHGQSYHARAVRDCVAIRSM